MKILVVDDHPLIRQAMAGVLQELRPDTEILDAPHARGLAECLETGGDVSLVLLDLTLPDADGFEVLSGLRRDYPKLPVVVFSADQDRDVILRALQCGALGFVPKSAERAVMLRALELILAGGVYVPPEVLGTTARRSPPRPTPSLLPSGLTERQAQVLGLMMEGKSNKAICRVLGIAEPTVKNHVTAILRALNATNRTEAVLAASERYSARHDS